jgi:hypothetical protein
LTKTLPPLDYKEEVIVLGVTEPAPASATEIGEVKVGDTGFSTNCGWDVVIAKAIAETRKAGGNVLKIISHKPPTVMGSTCDRITAKILKVDDPEVLSSLRIGKDGVTDSSWNYAKLFIYRSGGVGSLIGYDVYLGDSVIWRAKNNTKLEILITKTGRNTLWARTEAKSEVPITFEYGKEYYLKCSIVMGIMVGRPKLELIDRAIGKAEYNSSKE